MKEYELFKLLFNDPRINKIKKSCMNNNKNKSLWYIDIK